MKFNLTNKQWFFSTLGLVAAISGLCAALNYWVDPLLQFRFNPDRPPYIKDNNRHVNPGIIMQLNYDTVITGTSMAQNFKPAHLEQALGGSAINIAMSGSSIWEQSTYLKLALNTGSVDTVFMCLDAFMFDGDISAGAENLMPHLYTKHPSVIDRLKYLLSGDSTKLSFKTLTLQGEPSKQKYFDIKNSAHSKSRGHYGREITLQSWHSPDRHSFFRANFEPDKLKANFRANLQPLIADNPDTRFIILLPPYSILFWSDLQSKGTLNDILNFKQWLATELHKFENTVIYDLQDRTEITHNLGNYKDMYHYSPAIGQLIFELVAGNKSISSPTESNTRILAQLAQLDLQQFTRQQ